jgi:hypothetical protein
MTQGVRQYFFVSGLVIMGSLSTMLAQPTIERAQDHTAWVGQALQNMLIIQPGMSRDRLLTIFTTEGGSSNRCHRQDLQAVPELHGV